MRKIMLLFSVALMSLSTFAQNAEGALVKIGDNVPEFTLNSARYGTVNSKDLKGKVVLITIFATWCGPCQKELAELQNTLWPKYKDNKDFVLLVVGREHTDAQLEKYNKKKGFTFPLYPDPKRVVTSQFAERYIPRTFLVDKEGKIIYNSVGYVEEEFQKLMNMIDEALKK